MSADDRALVNAMRSTENIVSVPYGEMGAKVIITMTEETNLYELLSAAWSAVLPNPSNEGGARG